jgi:ATP-binding cassette subfamily B multidrug efflux pump
LTHISDKSSQLAAFSGEGAYVSATDPVISRNSSRNKKTRTIDESLASRPHNKQELKISEFRQRLITGVIRRACGKDMQPRDVERILFMYVVPSAKVSKESNLRWIWQYGKPDTGKVVCAVILFALDKVMTLIPPFVAGMIVDQCITHGLTDRLIPLLAIQIGTNIGHMALRYSYEVILQLFGQNTIYRLVSDEFEKLHQLDFQYFNHVKNGDVMNRMTSDTDAIRFFISWVAMQILDCVVMFVSALVVMFVMEWRLALALAVLSPIMLVVARTMAKKAHGIFFQIRQSLSRLNSCVEENIEANRVVKAFAREPYEIKKFEKHNQDYFQRNMVLAHNNARYLPWLDGMSYLLDVITLILGGLLVIQGHMTLGVLVSFQSYEWMIDGPVRMVGWLLNDLEHFQASCIKIRGLLSAKSRIVEPDHRTAVSQIAAVKPVSQETVKAAEQSAQSPSASEKFLKSLPKIKGDIVFDHVSFAFPDDPDTLVLDDVSFHAHPGEKLGIFGETGSGKSTLVSLIARFYDPTKGHVYIDGVDARDWPLETLRSQVILAFQDTFLFSDTIGENIAFGNHAVSHPEDFEKTDLNSQSDQSDDQAQESDSDDLNYQHRVQTAQKNRVDSGFIRQMAKIADADDFIGRMPEGYDTVIGERGVGLSGGQKQRISLARALADNPSVLIMDDTTSAVDMETEAAIQKNLRELGGTRTIVTIAYRISSVRDSDEILVLEHGKVVERGTHDQLVALNGRYADIYRKQLGLSMGADMGR